MTIKLGDVRYPELQPLNSSDTTVPDAEVRIDPTNPEECAIITTIPQDGELVAVHVVAVNTIAATLTCRIEGVVPATGNPDNTLIDASATATKGVVINGEIQVVDFVFPANVPVTGGQVVAIRISTDTGPIDLLRHTELQRAFPYLRKLDNVTWSQLEGMVPQVFQYDPAEFSENDDEEYVSSIGGFPVSFTDDVGGLTGANAEFYMSWIMQFDAVIPGIWIRGRLSDGGGTGQLDYDFVRILSENFPENDELPIVTEEEILTSGSILESNLVQEAAPSSFIINATFTKDVQVKAGERVAIKLRANPITDWSPVFIKVFADAFANVDDLTSENKDKYTLPFAKLIDVFIRNLNTNDGTRFSGLVPDMGIRLRNIRSLQSIGGGSPPGVVSAMNVLKAESLRQALTSEEQPGGEL